MTADVPSDNVPSTLASLRAGPGRAVRRVVSSGRRDDVPAEVPQLGLFGSAVERPASATPTPLVPAPHRIASRPTPAAPLARSGDAVPLEPRGTGPVLAPQVWTVRAIVADLRQRIEGGHGEVWVEGEISNCRSAASGHLYLTLKDGEAQLPTVLFRRQAMLLRFKPAAGMAVLVRGRLSVYEGRGELQLIGETLEPRGAGALLLAFEQLKARLAAEGLFDRGRKRALPAFPKCIGVVTSTSGAVLHDIINVVRRRHGRVNLLVYPAAMQGPGCAASVAAGVRWFNRNADKAEVILLARGGGSAEDLQGFNDEALARVIAASALPVVSAIGHETDFTIADFVADLRAPTPSAAAEIITASQHRIEERVDALGRRLERAGRFRLVEARARFARTSAEQVLRRVQAGLDRRGQRLDELERRLQRAMEVRAAQRFLRLERLRARLERQDVRARLLRDGERLAQLRQRVLGAVPGLLGRRRAGVERAAARLEAMSPLAVLARGYALVYTVSGSEAGAGRLIRSSADVSTGQQLRARLAEGSVLAQVTATEDGGNNEGS